MKLKKITPITVFWSLGVALMLIAVGGGAVALARPSSQSQSPPPVRLASSSLFPLPAYDSQWLTVGPRPDPLSIVFNHNLGGNSDDYLVVLECRDDTSLATYSCMDMGFNVNALWYGLTDTSVNVLVAGGTRPDDIRVRIYTMTPAYDSDWQVIGIRPDPISVGFTHNVGGDLGDYLVSLECEDNSSLSTYQCMDLSFRINAMWFDLTTANIDVWIQNGTVPDGVRVRIYTLPPQYDSDWQSLGPRPDPIAVPFTHNLGGDRDDYLVSLQCQDDTTLATYQCVDMGFNLNAVWFDLDSASVDTYAWGGTRPDGLRMRIWRTTTTFLPAVPREISAP